MANELRKRQLSIGGLVEDNPLSAAATLLTSAGLAAISSGVASTEHMAIVLDPDGIDGAPEVAYLLDVTNGASVTGAAGLSRGQEGTTARAHVAGTPWVHAPTLRDVVRHKEVKRATGTDMQLNSTAIAEVAAATNGPGSGGFDLVVPAYAGDVLEATLAMRLGGELVAVTFDVYTMVSGSRTNPFGGGLSASNAGALGESAWYAESNANGASRAGSSYYVVQSGDIASGLVTLRPHYVTTSATNRTLFSSSTLPFKFFVKNLGPATATT